MAKKRYYEESYAGYDMRRRQEAQDAAMIKEDKSAIANLPQDVKYVQYPQSPYSSSPRLDDSIRGIDRQLSDDAYSKSLKKGSDSEMY